MATSEARPRMLTSINNSQNTARAASRYSLADTGKPPALILGGGANAISVARCLGRAGVTTYAINSPDSMVRYSRFARWIRLPEGDLKQIWSQFLLGPESDHLRGAVLLPASDTALEVFIEHYDALAAKYRLDLFVPSAQAAMLNKLETYQAASRAGVATPRFWIAQSRSEMESLKSEYVFPLLIKPLYSHRFAARFGVKFLVANSYEELCTAWHDMDEGLEVMLVEKIPGPDSQLCSYYTYIDEQGEHCFSFTKRIIRRFPPEMGIACRHVTDHIPELVEPATRLFREVGLRGLANVEFKRDPRDGQLKLIECNARFTAANILLDRCGYDLARFVYDRACGRPILTFPSYSRGVYLWNPIDDLRAFRVLYRRGELTLADWLRSIAHPRVVVPYFQWSDPVPTLIGSSQRLRRLLRRLIF